MPQTIVSRQPPPAARPRRETTRANYSATYSVIDEVNAFIAARDGLLQETEQSPTADNVKRLATANDFVSNCLRPAREAYIHQGLPEVDAARQLQRCYAISTKIRKLRADFGVTA